MIPKQITRDKRAGCNKVNVLMLLDKVKAFGNRFRKSIITGAKPKHITAVKVRRFQHSKLLPKDRGVPPMQTATWHYRNSFVGYVVIEKQIIGALAVKMQINMGAII